MRRLRVTRNVLLPRARINRRCNESIWAASPRNTVTTTTPKHLTSRYLEAHGASAYDLVLYVCFPLPPRLYWHGGFFFVPMLSLWWYHPPPRLG
jgi:hypothetical protein